MTIGRKLASLARSLNVGSRAALGPNFLINGNFDIWQRGTSFSAAAYGPDRWFLINSGSTKAATRQAFTVGQTDVPGSPAYFTRHVVTSVAGAGSFVIMAQRLEGVRTLAGKRVTFTVWAKADTNRNALIELYQHFGSGGSPSTAVGGIGSKLIALTTTWKKFSVTFDIPSIAGKTLGTNGDDYLGAHIWFDAGSNFTSRAPGLGQQSGTFDIARASLIEGDVTSVDDPFPERLPAQEFALCQRFYQQAGEGLAAYTSGTATIRIQGQMPVPMRINPSYALLRTAFTFLQGNTTKSLSGVTVSFARVKFDGFRFNLSNTGDTALTASTPGQYYDDSGPLFEFDAEL